MKPLRVIAVDDELLARKRLTRLLQATPGVELLGVLASGQELLDRLALEDCDVVLLDIHMDGLSGLEVTGLLPEDGPAVIFTTAHPDHAVEAFELGALDYVLKPVEPGRLQRALDRARRQLFPAPRAPRERLAVETRTGIQMLHTDRISHVEIEGALTCIVSLEQGRLYTEESLQKLQGRLPGFERVHRRALVNLGLVERFEGLATGGYLAHLEGGGQVQVSRAVARRLRRRLG